MDWHPRVKYLVETRGVGLRLMDALDGSEDILTFPHNPGGCAMAGTSGAGKSFAMVRHMAGAARIIVERAPDQDKALWPSGAVMWAGWSQKPEELKRWLGQDQREAVEARVKAAKACQWL